MKKEMLTLVLSGVLLLSAYSLPTLSSQSILSQLYSGLHASETTNIMSISASLQYTNPFPLFDNLTESEMIGHGPDGDEPAQPNKGYWSLTVPGWGTLWDRWTGFGTVVGKTTTKCVGNYSIGSQVPSGSNPGSLWIGNCIYFDFDFVVDVTQWHYLKFYLWLGPGATGYGEFGLKDANGKWATIQYGPLPLQQWQPMSADIWDQSKWGQIDSGFNWSAVVTLGVYASNWYGPSEALIDSPLFYTGSNDLPHGKISFSETETNFSRLFTELYYVASSIESGKEYDVYVVHTSYRNKATSPVYILPFVKILMAMEDVASEYGNTETPQAGYYDYTVMMTFGISIPPFSVSFPITLPQLQVDFQTSYGSGVYKVEWTVKDPWFVSGRNVVKRNNYADFVITVKVPKGFKPYVTVMAEAQWYIYNPARDMYLKYATEQLGWLIVDPPEANPIDPEIPNPEPLPTDEIATAAIKEMKVRGYNFISNPAFAFGTFGWSLSDEAEITDTISLRGGSSVKLPPLGTVRQSVSYRYVDEITIECWVYSPADNQTVAIAEEYEGGTTAISYILKAGWNKLQFNPLQQHSKIVGVSITADFSNTQPVYLDYVDAYKCKNFNRGDSLEVWLEIFWVIQDKPLSISVEITDSSGKLIGMVELLASSYVNGTSICGFELQVPGFASTGTAEVRVGLWTNWKWKTNADEYGVDTTQTFDIR